MEGSTGVVPFSLALRQKGKLSFLNNLIGSFEGEFDSDRNFTRRSWEWK